MALHELCTNALKYGALSCDGGHVDIFWELFHDGEAKVRMTWREQGGPRVEPPASRGFGTMLVEKALAHELRAHVAIDFCPEGVVCTIEAPLPGEKACA